MSRKSNLKFAVFCFKRGFEARGDYSKQFWKRSKKEFKDWMREELKVTAKILKAQRK